MPDVLAAIRPDEQSFALLLHLVGATVVFGALLASAQTGASAELTALNRTTTGLLLRAAASGAIVLIVIDMIWKPGA